MSYHKTYFFEHPRFDVCDTRPFRVAYVGLGAGPVIELYVLGPVFHHYWLLLASALQVAAWIMGMWCVVARESYIQQKQDWLAMEAEHDRIRREWGLE